MAFVGAPPVVLRTAVWNVVTVVVLFLGVSTVNAQCEDTGECFCNSEGNVTVAQLVSAVNILLGQAPCPDAPLTPTPVIPIDTATPTDTPTATPTTGPGVLTPGVTIQGVLNFLSQIDVYTFSLEAPAEVILQLDVGDGTYHLGCVEIREVPGASACDEGMGEGPARLDINLPANTYILVVTTMRHTYAYNLSYQVLPATTPACDLCPCPAE